MGDAGIQGNTLISQLHTLDSPSQRHTSAQHWGLWVKSLDMFDHVLQIGRVGGRVGDRCLGEIAGQLVQRATWRSGTHVYYSKKNVHNTLITFVGKCCERFK